MTENAPTLPDATPRDVLDWEVTGNHYLSIPCINPSDGSIDRLNVLHRGQNGLLEWAGSRRPGQGEPLLCPRFRVGGEEVALEDPAWETLDHWIPRFRSTVADGLRVTGTICAPGGPESSAAGAVYRFELENAGSEARQVEVALEGVWTWSLRTVSTTRSMAGRNRLWRPVSDPAVVLEQADGAGAALAVTGEGSPEVEVVVGTGLARSPEPDEDVAAANGEPITFAIRCSVAVPARGRGGVAFYFGVGPERDGALAAAKHLARHGAAGLVRDARLALARMARRVRDGALGRILNRNLIFNFFFAIGRTVDDDRLYPVSSRSTLFDGGAATFGERRALLWSHPALTLVDPLTAREVLLQIFDRYSILAGAESKYLDGAVLGHGYMLDGTCAYGIALERFIADGGDAGILDEPVVQQVLSETQHQVLADLHPEIFVCATDLAPSGDVPSHRYVTYDNVLVARFSRALDVVWKGRDGERPALDGAADEVTAALWREATAEIDGLHVLAFSSDLAGESAIYDDPAGSLQLLPFYGFCDADDPIWKNTVELLRSESYPLWHGNAPFPGLADARDGRHAALAALCADLLGARRDAALELIRRLPLPGGVACERYDPTTGKAAGGMHSAALAGFLAWALWWALER